MIVNDLIHGGLPSLVFLLLVFAMKHIYSLMIVLMPCHSSAHVVHWEATKTLYRNALIFQYACKCTLVSKPFLSAQQTSGFVNCCFTLSSTCNSLVLLLQTISSSLFLVGPCRVSSLLLSFYTCVNIQQWRLLFCQPNSVYHKCD